MNLQVAYQSLSSSITKQIHAFSDKHDPPSSIGIYSCPWYGWASTNFNQKKSLEETDFNCPDFEFVEYGFFEFPDWEAAYDNENPQYIDHLGIKRTLNHHFENDIFSAPVFDMLIAVAQEVKASCDRDILVQILDSTNLKVI